MGGKKEYLVEEFLGSKDFLNGKRESFTRKQSITRKHSGKGRYKNRYWAKVRARSPVLSLG